MNETIRFRKKSAMAEAKVKKLEDGIKKDFLDKKTMVIEQNELLYVDEIWDYRQELIILMLWIGPYVIKETSDKGAMQLMKSNGKLFPGKVTDRRTLLI